MNDTSRDDGEEELLDLLRSLNRTPFVASAAIPAFARPALPAPINVPVVNPLGWNESPIEVTSLDPPEIFEAEDPSVVLRPDTRDGAKTLPPKAAHTMDDDTMAEWAAVTARTLPRADTWEDIIGNERAIASIRESIASAKERNLPVDHILIFGPAGMGKTTISKIIARDMGSGFTETTAGTLSSGEEVMRVLHKMNQDREATKMPSVWFIDEIHVLGKKGLDQEAFFPLLEDWVFHHDRQGKRVSFIKDMDWRTSTFLAWPFTAIGATTDPGTLSAPLTRRFNIQVELEPYSENDIAEIIRRGALRLSIDVTETAAATLASYSRRTPGRAFNILSYARNRMDANKAPAVSDDIIAETIERMNIFPLGLTRNEVRALELLAGRYPKGIGHNELSGALGIQPSQFTNMMEPYLRQLEFVKTLNRRVITLRGIRYLASIGRADTDLAAIRAVLSRG